MSAESPEPRFQLYYWPTSFRGCFASYLFAWCDVPFTLVDSYDDNVAMKNRPLRDQPVPYMGPPLLLDREADRALSQMPAVVLYAASELDVAPQDPFELAMAMKVLMDCNDVLMEICRYNGSSMWQREEWVRFRTERLVRWLGIFEESATRGYIGGATVSFADIGVYALFGNMIRCLPELEPDLVGHAPRVHALCKAIGSKPSLATAVAADEARYGNQYCGGQIEASIREMLAMDLAE